MKKNEISNQYYYKIDNNNMIPIRKRLTNLKSNSPFLSHQENNFFYNTKINHLILQNLSNSNRGPNMYQQQNSLYDSVYINYDILNQDINNISNMNQKREEINSNSLNKDNKSRLGLYNFINSRRNIDRESKSFLDENSYNNNYVNKNANSKIKDNHIYDKNNKNNYNPFQVLNYLKKRRNINSNSILKLRSKDLNIETNNDNNTSKTNLTQNADIKSKQNSKIFQGLSQKKINNDFFFEIKNNINNDMQNVRTTRNIDLNNLNGFKKIPFKKDNVGKYQIKSPGIYNSKKINNNDKIKKIEIEKKSEFKSPEMIGKNRNKNLSLKNSKNVKLNNISTENKSEIGFYKKNNEISVNNALNFNNSIVQNRHILNNSLKVNKVNNNISQYNLKNNNINQYTIKNNNNNLYLKSMIRDNLLTDDEQKINTTQNEIYIKINPRKSTLVNKKTKNNKDKESLNIKNISGIKILNNNKKIDYEQIKNNIERSCDILEQFYYNSFKNCFIFFIRNMSSYGYQKNSNRSDVLKRITGGKKSNNQSNNLNHNISKTNLDTYLNNNKNINKEINDPRKKNKSPDKFVELQKNIMPSMMKINQDNYIEMFNEIFNKQNQSFIDKKCRSPIIEKRKLGENNNILNDSFNLDNSNNKEKEYNKYKTNTNVNLYFPKMNNLNLNNNLVYKNKKNDSNINKNNVSFQKSNFRPSLSIDNKKQFLNDNSNSKTNKYNNIKQYQDKNKKENVKEDNIYNDSKIFQNQKYKIEDAHEQFFIYNNNGGENSDQNEYDKMVNTETHKNHILYSKPVLKKSISKIADNNKKSNNINIINLKNDRNNKQFDNKINIFHSQNLIHVNQNLSQNPPPHNTNQKSIFDNLNYKEEIKNLIKENQKYCEIIIKNVSTKDKRLNVFIKYIDLGNTSKKQNKNNINKKLIYYHIDSFSLISHAKRYNNRSFAFRNSLNYNNENEFDNVNLDKKRFLNYTSDRNYINEKNKKYKDKYNKKTFTNIKGEESFNIINNLNYSIEGNNKNNEDIINSITYLINYLQNMFNDNKKLVLFNFFKNLKKIKTNALLHSSKNRNQKNKSKNNANIINTQRYHNKYIIEINNFNNYKNINSNRSIDINNKNNKPYIKKDYNLKEEFFQNNYKKAKNSKKINEINYKAHHYNTSFTKNNNIPKTNKTELILEDYNSKKENNRNKTFKNDEKFNNTEIKEKEKLKEIKLAKLGKIFKNLEQENNIISAIKEQFLEWSNNNNIELRRSDTRNKGDDEKEKRNKKYGIKTFDMKFMFNNSLNEDNNHNIKVNKKNEEFQTKLNTFRKQLIIFSFKNKIIINNNNENEYENNDKEIQNKNISNEKKFKNLEDNKDIDSLNKKDSLELGEEKEIEEEDKEKIIAFP